MRDEIAERVARAITVAQDKWWSSKEEPGLGLSDTLARAAIAAYETALREKGFIIHDR